MLKKRMGTRLRNAKKANKNIGGRDAGKLTDKVIGKLTKYYGLAIRRNSNSVNDMKKEVWATFYHKSSTEPAARLLLARKRQLIGASGVMLKQMMGPLTLSITITTFKHSSSNNQANL